VLDKIAIAEVRDLAAQLDERAQYSRPITD
jgi:hypothetical protein